MRWWRQVTTEGKEKQLQAVVFFFPKLSLLVVRILKGIDSEQRGREQRQKLRHAVVILRKTHPDILFCLFGLVRVVAKHSSAHTAVETDMESFTTNLHVEEIPSVCFSPSMVSKREVYYQGEDVYCHNIIRYLTLMHTINRFQCCSCNGPTSGL